MVVSLQELIVVKLLAIAFTKGAMVTTTVSLTALQVPVGLFVV
jgi:hypothetical protein